MFAVSKLVKYGNRKNGNGKLKATWSGANQDGKGEIESPHQRLTREGERERELCVHGNSGLDDDDEREKRGGTT